MAREAILLIRTEQGVNAQHLPVPEALARFKLAVVTPPPRTEGINAIEVWVSDAGMIKRHRFGAPQVATDAGKSFQEGNAEAVAQMKENQRRSREGLPSLEEEAAMDDQRKAHVQAQAKAARERVMDEDARRKSQGRPTISEQEAAAAAIRKAEDDAETAARRAVENTIRKAQGRMTLEEEDAFIEKRRLESLTAKGLVPVAAPPAPVTAPTAPPAPSVEVRGESVEVPTLAENEPLPEIEPAKKPKAKRS